jgi:hypothetical protein
MMARILDACCGARMFWFDKKDKRAIFMDKRSETILLKDSRAAGGTRRNREFIISPDIVGDFTKMDFADETFYLVVFDPPHILHMGDNACLVKEYGKLPENWREVLKAGFSECFRVLKSNGVLIFKWMEQDIKVSEILELTTEKPLFGNRCGRISKTHWITFMKAARG